MTSPSQVKLFDIHDIALSLASLNANADLTGELVDVGLGRPRDFEGKDVTGKFVVSAGRAGRHLHPGRPAWRLRRSRRERDRLPARQRLPDSDRVHVGHMRSPTPSPGR